MEEKDPVGALKVIRHEDMVSLKTWEVPIEPFDEDEELEFELQLSNPKKKLTTKFPGARDVMFIRDWVTWKQCAPTYGPSFGTQDARDVRNALFKPFEPQLPLIPTPWLCDITDKSAIQWDLNPLNNKHAHPRNKRVKFVMGQSGERAYFIDGNCAHILSSTGMPKAFYPFTAVGWEHKRLQKLLSWKKDCEYRRLRRMKPRKCPVEPHYVNCETPADIKAMATYPGTMHHQACELDVQGLLTEEKYEALSDDTKTCLGQFRELRKDPRIKHMINWWAEGFVFDEDLLLATQTDLVLYNPLTKKYVIVDHKRMDPKKLSGRGYWNREKKCYNMGRGICQNRKNCPLSGYQVQLNFVKYIMETKYNMPVEAMYLAQVHPSKPHGSLCEIPDMGSMFVHMLQERARALKENEHLFKRPFPVKLDKFVDRHPKLPIHPKLPLTPDVSSVSVDQNAAPLAKGPATNTYQKVAARPPVPLVPIEQWDL
jgi:hypothetical protein